MEAKQNLNQVKEIAESLPARIRLKYIYKCGGCAIHYFILSCVLMLILIEILIRKLTKTNFP